MKHDPISSDTARAIATKFLGMKEAYQVAELPRPIGVDNEGRAFSMPVWLFSNGTEAVTVTKRGRATRAVVRPLLNGRYHHIVGQEPLPYGGSWDSAEETAYREWAV